MTAALAITDLTNGSRALKAHEREIENWLKSRFDNDWQYLVTLVFDKSVSHEEAKRRTRNFIHQADRKLIGRSRLDKCPALGSQFLAALEGTEVDERLHYHVLMRVSEGVKKSPSGIKTALNMLLLKKKRKFGLVDFDVSPITRTPERVLSYCVKEAPIRDGFIEAIICSDEIGR